MAQNERKAQYKLSPVAKLIEYRLEERKLTWVKLAQALDTTRAMMSHIRKGRRTMGAELLARMAEYLNIPIPDLEYAQAVHLGEVKLALDTLEKRACALAFMRIWHSCTPEQFGRLQHVAEHIHIEQVN